MDVTKEIRCRLQVISQLLKEVEDIIIRKNKMQNNKFLNDQSHVCICGQESSREILSCDYVKDKNSKNNKTIKQLNSECSEKHVKCEELDKKYVSSDIKDIGPCSWKTYKQNHEKKNLDKVSCTLCCESSNIRVQTDYASENYTNKLNDIKQMFMSYFEDIVK